MKKKFKAMVLSCIDPRFQPLVYNFLRKKRLTGKYSAFTIAGASIGVTLSMSLTKAVMIETLKATSEFEESEKRRKALDPLLW